MTVNEQPPDEPAPAGGLPEIRLKPGFKKPGQSANPKESSPSGERPSRNGPLSFDDMLEFTSRPAAPIPKSIVDQPESKPASPVQRSAPPAQQPAPPALHSLASIETEPVAREFPTSLPSGLGGFEMPPQPPQPSLPPQPNFPSPSSFPPPAAHPNPLLMGSNDRPERAWLKPAGLAVLVLMLSVALVVLVLSLIPDPIKLKIKSKPTGAAVYLGEERLGKTPLKVELASLEEKPVLKLKGYKTQPIPDFKQSEAGKISKVYAILERVSFPANWTGLPKGTRVWWDGSETQPKSIVAGKHEVKVKSPGQSSFIWSLTVPWTKGEEYPIGQTIAKEIKRRPTLKLSLSGANKANVIVKDGPRFTKTISMSKTPVVLSVPSSGTYLVIVKATGQNASFKKEIALKEASQKSVEIALWRPRVAPTQTYHRNPSRPYRPSRPRYNPPPVYHGGGGGGGQIAPPSF